MKVSRVRSAPFTAPIVSFPVPVESRERMAEHDVDWGAVLRECLGRELDERENRDPARTASKRLGAAAGPVWVLDRYSAGLLRE